MTDYAALSEFELLPRYGGPLESARLFEFADKAAAAERRSPFDVYVEVRGYVEVRRGLLVAPLRRPADEQALALAEVKIDDATRVGILHPWLERAVVKPAIGSDQRHHTEVERDRVEGGGTVTDIAAPSDTSTW